MGHSHPGGPERQLCELREPQRRLKLVQWQLGGPRRQLGGPWGIWNASEAAGRALGGKGGKNNNENGSNKWSSSCTGPQPKNQGY